MKPLLKATLILFACLGLSAPLPGPAAEVPAAPVVDTGSDTSSPRAERDLVLGAMREELDRSFTGLRLPGFEAPYYIGFRLDDEASYTAKAEFGVLQSSGTSRWREIAVDLRVGNYAMDNTRPSIEKGLTSLAALDNDPVGLRTDFWQLADAEYKLSNREFFGKKAYVESRPKEIERPDDFSHETPVTRIEEFSAWSADAKAAEDELRKASARFASYPVLDGGSIDVWGSREREYLVNTEGSRAAMEFTLWMLTLSAHTQADNGSPVGDEQKIMVKTWKGLPGTEALSAQVDAFAQGLMRLREAPEQEPCSGPVLLAGPAAGVFAHQVLGHLLGGENQKDENADQELKDKLGDQILPPFISLWDDPNQDHFKGEFLFGHYDLDDQLVPAQKASLVEDGVFKGYLLSRTPVKGFPRSNGHGRSDTEHESMGRLAVLTLSSRKTLNQDGLKAQLLKECRRQEKPYGFIVRRLLEQETRKSDHKAFRLIPTEIYRVDARTGREELVRGVEIVGTALIAMGRLKVTGDDPFALNTLCDYGSGNQAISVISPSLLFSELELQRSDSPKTRLKILKPPFAGKP